VDEGKKMEEKETLNEEIHDGPGLPAVGKWCSNLQSHKS